MGGSWDLATLFSNNAQSAVADNTLQMSPSNRIAAMSTRHIWLWTLAALSSPALVGATAFSLSSDITKFIPSCAIGCFESFLDANFAADVCSTSPTLDCLCTHNGATGFTVGEGAVQCIIGEENVGACTGSEVTRESSGKGFPLSCCAC